MILSAENVPAGTVTDSTAPTVTVRVYVPGATPVIVETVVSV